MWDLLFKFIDGDTDTVDTDERMYVKCNIHDIKRKSIRETRPSPETLDALNQLVEERALFTKSILKGTDYWIKTLIENKDIIVKEWMKRSKKINSKIKFYYKDQLVNGIYKGIADDGSIEVLMENKKNNFFNLELI